MEKQSNVCSDLASIPVGKHCILELYGCPAHLLDQIVFIETALQEASEIAKSTLLKQVSYQFDPCGVTSLALLAESHISVHTWPESGYVAIDVFTCGQHTQPEQACHYLVEAFQCAEHSLETVARGRFSAKLQSVIKGLQGQSPHAIANTSI